MKLLKGTPSRRERALFRLALCVLVVLGAMGLRLVSLTPTQTLRFVEHSYDLDRTEVLGQTKLGSHRLTFSANEEVLLLTKFRPPVQSSLWERWAPYCAGPLSPDAPAAPCWVFWYQAEDAECYPAIHFLFFGRVDLPGAAAVRIQNSTQEPEDFVQADLFTGPDGHRYLWAEHEANGFYPEWVDILDQNGAVLKEQVPFTPYDL